MYKLQSNTARFIYTLSARAPIRGPTILLKNGYYFNKEARSDEKLLYRESDMRNLITTAMKMIVFSLTPYESMYEIIHTGEVTLTDVEFLDHEVTMHSFIEMLDELFGKGFSSVASRPILQVYKQYMSVWRYYQYGDIVDLPTADDFIKLFRFMNTANPKYSTVTEFLLCNATDRKTAQL